MAAHPTRPTRGPSLGLNYRGNIRRPSLLQELLVVAYQHVRDVASPLPLVEGRRETPVSDEVPSPRSRANVGHHVLDFPPCTTPRIRRQGLDDVFGSKHRIHDGVTRAVRRRRRAFIQSEEVRSTHCRVAPTRASPLDWRRPPPHESCSTMARPIPLPSRLCCHALKSAGPFLGVPRTVSREVGHAWSPYPHPGVTRD